MGFMRHGTDGGKNDENRIRNKEVVTFWNFKFFRKTFLGQSLWIFKWVSWWCHRLTICHIYYTWNFENFHFFPDTGKSTILVSKYIRINIISKLFGVDIRQGLHSHSWNIIFVSFVNEMCRKLWGDDIINSLIWIFIRTGQEMFSEKMWNFLSQLPYFLSDFHHICTNL